MKNHPVDRLELDPHKELDPDPVIHTQLRVKCDKIMSVIVEIFRLVSFWVCISFMFGSDSIIFGSDIVIFGSDSVIFGFVSIIVGFKSDNLDLIIVIIGFVKNL